MLQSELKVGDTVTADSWDGETCVIEGFIPGDGDYPTAATFKEGGFWRLSALRKVEDENA